jgi:phosphonate transport system substrate-binding protein
MNHLVRSCALALLGLLAVLAVGCGGTASNQEQAGCPNNGTVRFAVEPFQDSSLLLPVYQVIATNLAKALGCKVDLTITTNYTAEVEAMRAGKLEMGEFGPLGYVFAHKLAKAEPLVTFGDKEGATLTYTASVVTWNGSGITTLKQVAGKNFAYSDPASTSGHLFPAYALKKAGIDPDTGVKGVYAGSHTASFEAIRNHKVDAGELNSSTITTTTKTGEYNAGDYTTLWKSDPIPQDPIAVRGDLPEAFKQKVQKALLSLDLSQVNDPKQVLAGPRLVKTDDATYKPIRDLVDVLHIDLNKIG